MPTYRVTVRDGRLGPADPPYDVRADDYGGLAQAICHIAEEPSAEVVIEQREGESGGAGVVYCGFDTIAHFDVEEIP